MTAEELFDLLNNTGGDTVFTTDETENLFFEFVNDNIESLKQGKASDKAIKQLYALIEIEEKNAFVVGFNTAISLILGRKQEVK